jgi:hypothetical protein
MSANSDWPDIEYSVKVQQFLKGNILIDDPNLIFFYKNS